MNHSNRTGCSRWAIAIVGLSVACVLDNPWAGDETGDSSPAGCGDGVVDPGEQCDLGPNNGETSLCTASCRRNRCGDGIRGPGEGCDDGNTIDTDACTNACAPTSCGDGIVDPDELCDDGNATNTDVCTNSCAPAACGDGWAQGWELCDDANLFSFDACLPDCSQARCGDGFRHIGVESCDDGNTTNGDGCDADCRMTAIVELSSSAAANHTCALLSTGEASCWGSNATFQLGFEHSQNVGDDELPTARIEIDAAIVDLCVGTKHTCALDDAGALRCWGHGVSGQLGTGSTGLVRAAEAEAISFASPPVALWCAGNHACVATEAGDLVCWGANDVGQLGLGSTTPVGDDETPAASTPIGGSVVELALGPGHSCAMNDRGELVCWGSNQDGQLGLGHKGWVGNDELAYPDGRVSIARAPFGFESNTSTPEPLGLALGVSSTCAVWRSTGLLRCWGAPGHGILGRDSVQVIGDEPDELPRDLPTVELDAAATGVTVGGEHACALTTAGEVICWGRDEHGQLGYPDTNTNIPPSSQGSVEIGGPAIAIVAGQHHTCALRDDQTVLCWGRNQFGQLGLGHAHDVGQTETPASAGVVTLYRSSAEPEE